jgi:hypothetical protein
MSNHQIHDHIQLLADIVAAEPDPLRRLKAARTAEQQSKAMFRRIVRKAAYDARMTFSSQDIQEITGIDRKDIEYLVRVYLLDNPMEPRPKQRQRADLSTYLDLRREQ